MNNQSILVSIQNSINQITGITHLQKAKATKICKSMFNQFIIDGTNLWDYKQFGRNYFTSIIPTKRDYNLKHILVDNGILDCDNWYKFVKDSNKGVTKGYKFNSKFYTGVNISSTEQTFTFSTNNTGVTISYYCPHGDTLFAYPSQTQFLQNYLYPILDRLTFDEDIDIYINELSKISITNLTIDENIPDQFIYLILQKEKYRYSRQKAIEFALNTGNHLIKYKDKFYIDLPERFIENKSIQLRISYCQSVFNIKNKLFYCDRNDTNNRLDYNLTGLKKELFTKLRIDGEKLVELDIANAQFAIAAHLNTTIDANFIDNASRGTLYRHIENELKKSKGTGKELMFRVAFDKVKYDYEFEQIRSLFPKYMKWVDSYKKEHGYKSFSNFLQRKEAEIMIDGLLMVLIKKGYEVFTIHDALRVKESQVNEIKVLAENHFRSMGFECLLRNGNEKS